MTKRRIRTLIRSGWTEVAVPRKNLYEWDPADPDKPFGDDLYMKELITWCNERFDAGAYHYALPPQGTYTTRYKDCFKRFVFKRQQDAMIFQLKWAE